MEYDAVSVIKRVYSMYHLKGVESIYLWGSSITEDYVSTQSDIDCVAIVKDSTHITLEKEIAWSISKEYPGILFDFHFLYISELNGGPSKTFLTSIINPALLLYDLPYWRYIDGVRFSQKDFSIDPPSPTKGIKLQLELMKKFGWLKVAEIPEKQQAVFLKTIARILYLRQKDRDNNLEPFSYSSLSLSITHSLDFEIMNIVMNSRGNGWNSDVLKQNKDTLQGFINSLLETFRK